MSRLLYAVILLLNFSLHAAPMSDCDRWLMHQDPMVQKMISLLNKRTHKSVLEAAVMLKSAGRFDEILAKFGARWTTALKKLRNDGLTLQVFEGVDVAGAAFSGPTVLLAEALTKIGRSDQALILLQDFELRQDLENIGPDAQKRFADAKSVAQGLPSEGEKISLMRVEVETLIQLRHFEDAIAVADRLLELSLTHPWPYRQKAYAYYSLGQYKSALANLERAMELGLKTSGMYMLRAKIQVRLGDNADAVMSAEQALHKAEATGARVSMGYHYVYAQALTKVGRLEEAEEILDQYPQMGRASVLRARIAIKRGEYRAAIAALKDSPPEPGVQWMRAQAQYGLGNLTTAYAVLMQMLNDPRCDRTWVVVALIKIERLGMPRAPLLTKILSHIGPARAAEFNELADTMSWRRIGDVDEELDGNKDESLGEITPQYPAAAPGPSGDLQKMTTYKLSKN